MNRILVLSLALGALACGSSKEKPEPPNAADALAKVSAAKSMPVEKYVSATAGFDLTLPGIWTGHYRAEEKRDTTAGARLGVEFKFKPDSGSTAPSLSLIVVRIFPRKAWDALNAPGPSQIGQKIGEKGDDVFVLSLAGSNPYPGGTKEAEKFDELMISIAQGGQQLHLTAR